MRLRTITPAWIKALRRGGLSTLLAALALLGATQVAGAVKSPPPPPNPDNPYADDKYVQREIKKQLRERDERDAKRKTDEAKAARKASRTKFKDKSNHEALEIARAKFDKLIGAPTWTGLTLREGERVKDYIDDFQALLQVGDEPDDVALVASELPLRNEQQEPIDLSLDTRGDGFAPAAGGVDLDIPGDLAEGIAVADGQLRIKPATDGETLASQAGEKVFYGNAQTDSDVMVVPSVRGFETLTQLRSAESPEQIAFDVEVAGGGATLRQEQPKGREQGEAPIEVLSPGGKRIATIAPPRAVAADGEPVEVSYSIEGMRVTMHVEHRDSDVAYPIMVDPDVIYEDWKTWSWANGNRDNYGWQYGSWGHPWCGFGAYFGQGAWTFGQIVYHPDGYYCEVDNWVEAKWQAPRMSYIYRTEYIHMNHQNRFTCAVNGLWNVWANNWDAGWAWVYCGDLWNHSRGHCPISDNCNPDYGAPSNVAVFKVQIAYGNGNRNPGARAELGGSLMYLRDRDNPVIDDNGKRTDTRWYRNGTLSVAPRAHDDGLGMNKFQLYIPGFVDDYRRHPCTRSRCPGSWTLPGDGQGTFSYNMADIPNGINSVTLNARDALDKITGSSWSLNVDDELPDLNVYGPLRDAVYAGTWSGSKTLSINAADGIYPYDNNPRNARAGITAVDIYVDNIKKHSQTQNCFSNCRSDFTWVYYADQYPAGNHSIRVVARDGAGNERSSSTWTVSSVPTAPGDSERFDPNDDGSDIAFDPGEGMDPSCDQDPEVSYTPACGQNTATTDANSEPAMAPIVGGLPKIADGSDKWGFADQSLTFTDSAAWRSLGTKRLRVYLPWDLLYRSESPAKYKWTARFADGTIGPEEKDFVPTSEPLKHYDDWFAKIRNLVFPPAGQPQLVKEVIISIYTTEANIDGPEADRYKRNPDLPPGPYKLGSRVLPPIGDPARPIADCGPGKPGHYEYICNVRRLIERFRSYVPIRYVAAFNEPNHPAYAPNGRDAFPELNPGDLKNANTEQIKAGAKRAAKYYNVLRKWCVDLGGGCEPIAGDFVDRDNLLKSVRRSDGTVDTTPSYLHWYLSSLRPKPPPIWGYHAYNAAAPTVKKGMTDSRLRTFLDRTKFKGTSSSVWLTEQGPLYAGSNGNWQVCTKKADGTPIAKDSVEQRDCMWQKGELSTKFLTGLPQISTRIKRFYYYAWSGEKNADMYTGQGHDSGLFDPNAVSAAPADRLRTAYCAYRARSNPFHPGARDDANGIRACP